MWPQCEGRGTRRGDVFLLCFPPIPHSPLPASPLMMLPCFCLSVAPAPVAMEPAITPLQLCLDLGIGNQARGFRSRSVPANEDGHPPDSTDIPATSCDVGSFIYDQENCIYPLEWEDLSSFHTWHREEEHAHSIELIASSTVSGRL